MHDIAFSQVNLSFGGIHALRNLNFEISKNNIIGIIGPNGAGKTTLFNCLTGFYNPNFGKITYSVSTQSGQHKYHLEKCDPLQVAHLGIQRTFQTPRLFKNMSVLENCLVACEIANVFSLKGLFLGTLKVEHLYIERVQQWLEFFGLSSHLNTLCGNLSYGNQRLVEIIRALCTNPSYLCLDEPAAGLNPSESTALKHYLQQLRVQNGIGLILIEHDMSLVMDLCDEILVLNLGELIAKGNPEEIKNNPLVIEAYLGKKP